MSNHGIVFIALAGLIVSVGGCSPKDGEAEKTRDPVQRVSTSEAIETFEADQSFWSWAGKTKLHGDSIYSLVFKKSAPKTKALSTLVVHTLQGRELPFSQLPPDFTLIDFDIAPNGRVIQLAFREIEGTEANFGFPLKELSVFIDSKKAFDFSDSKRNSAIRYDRNGKPSPARHHDHQKMYFLSTSPMTEFARLAVTDDRIFISAVGTFGFKVFCFDYGGREVSQTEILPATDFNLVLADEEAPLIELVGRRLVTAVTTSKEDADIFQKHFGVPLAWEGPKYQVVLQSFDLSLFDRAIRVVKGTANFFAAGVRSAENEVAIFGSSGGAGDRRALAVVLRSDPVRSDLSEQYRAEFTLFKESSLYAAAFAKDRLLVAGSTGSFQVSSGSVVEAGDSFVSSIDRTGVVTTVATFGTGRQDGVTSLVWSDGEIFLSGYEDGPITHTADTDANLAYQKWYLGKLKQSPAGD